MRFLSLRTRLMPAFLVACICLPLIIGFATARADNTIITCDNWADLYALLKQDPGGTIRLTGGADGVFHVDTAEYVTGVGTNAVTVTNPVTIELGDYGMEFDNAMVLTGPVTFIGTGLQRPVLRIKNGQRLVLYGGTIIATGGLPEKEEELASPTNEQPAQPPIALKVEDGAKTLTLEKGTQVLATGAGGIALDWECADRFIAKWVTLRAMGKGGTAMRITAGRAALQYCDVNGPVIAPEAVPVSFIGCRIDMEDMPQHATYATAHARAPKETDSSPPLKLYFPANSQPTLPQALFFNLFEYQENGHPTSGTTYATQGVTWDMQSVDWATPGEYMLRGNASMLINTLPIENLYLFDVPCMIYDSSELYLPYGVLSSIPGSGFVLDIFVLPAPNNSTVVREGNFTIALYHSADEGETWQPHVLTDGSYAASYSEGFDSFRFPLFPNAEYLMDGQPHWYYAALVDGDGKVRLESNNLILQINDSELRSDYGGDRDLGDRDSGEKPPAAAPPSNDPAATNGIPGVSGGGGYNSAQGGSASAGFSAAQQAGPPAPEEDEPSEGYAAPGAQASIPLGGIAEDAALQLPEGHSYARQHLEDMMAANPERVTLYENGVRLLIPTKALAELLGDAQELRITASPPQDGRVTFRLLADGVEIHLLPQGMEVSFAYDLPQSEPGTLYLVYGDEWIEARYEDGRVYATIYAMGEYTLVFRPAQPQDAAGRPDTLYMQQVQDGALPDGAAARGDFPIWPVAGGAGIAAMGGSTYWAQMRKRSRRRK